MNDLPGGRGGRFALALFALCAATSAFAQVDPRATAPTATATVTAPVENGIKMGEGRVHPYFDLETHYDSAAWSNTPKGTTNTQIFGEVVNHFRPGFRLDLPATAVDMSLNANVDYVWYTGLLNAQDTQASRLESGADLAANFNKNGPVGFEVGDRFSRSDR